MSSTITSNLQSQSISVLLDHFWIEIIIELWPNKENIGLSHCEFITMIWNNSYRYNFYCKTKRKTYTYSKRQGYIFILNICFPISVNGYFTFNNMFDRSKNEKRHQGPALLSYWVCPIMCILGPSLPPHPPILPKTQIKAIMHNLFNDYIGFPNHPLVRPKRNRTACTISPKGEAKTFEPCVPSVP